MKCFLISSVFLVALFDQSLGASLESTTCDCSTYQSLPLGIESLTENDVVESTYNCLNLVYNDGQNIQTVQQCISLLDSKSFCAAAAAKAQITKCEISGNFALLKDESASDNPASSPTTVNPPVTPSAAPTEATSSSGASTVSDGSTVSDSSTASGSSDGPTSSPPTDSPTAKPNSAAGSFLYTALFLGTLFVIIV
ncbi:uncharacterized protein DDB_G0284459-like [Sitophilus oryzae]|uniref:Uncharacterized protein DDB_G0284459-like n=1 Tax=Sitophilus oryzae TaxID=7048 RepID=A0A6J2XUK8_SITOR|nr:uncharacterized protein DDB_G0284459-like [Sitophilus oryzae]